MQAEPDSLRAVLDTVFAARAYEWVERPHPLGWLFRFWGRLLNALEDLRAANPELFRLMLWALVAVLLAILAHALWVFFGTLRHAAARETSGPRRRAERRDAAWYEREADALAAAGRYADALGAAFTALALRLEERGALAYRAGRTPRELVRDARLPEADRGLLRELVGNLYAMVFGGAACGADEVRQWRDRAGRVGDVAAA